MTRPDATLERHLHDAPQRREHQPENCPAASGTPDGGS